MDMLYIKHVYVYKILTISTISVGCAFINHSQSTFFVVVVVVFFFPHDFCEFEETQILNFSALFVQSEVVFFFSNILKCKQKSGKQDLERSQKCFVIMAPGSRLAQSTARTLLALFNIF